VGTRLAGNVTAGRDSQLVILGADNAVLDPAVVTPPAGAAVALGPLGDASSAVAALQELVAARGVVAAGGNVDLGDGFRSARLAGGTGDRRDGIVAALRVVPYERLGDRFAVLVALFGPAATRPVGAAALKAIDERRFAALALAAGASDVLGPEQLERILALDGDPVGDVAPSVIAAHLATLFPRVLPKRRLELLVSLWHLVIERQEARRRIERRLASQHRTPILELRAAYRAQEDVLVVQRVEKTFGETATLGLAARWLPDAAWVRERLRDLLHDAIAATALLRAALAVAEYGVQTGIQLALPQLRTADALGHRLPAVRDIVRQVRAGRILSVEDSHLVVERLSHAYDAGAVVLDAASSWLDFASSLPWDAAEYWTVKGLAKWRKVAGYSALRPPETWIGRPALSSPDALALADREPRVEQVGDLLWLAEVADELARFHGHERAVVVDDEFPSFDIDPSQPEPAGPSLRDDSLAAALAGAAQLVAFGATPARASDWSQFADGLAADALVVEAFTNTFAVPPALAERDGSAIPGTPARLEVARNPRQLAGWAQEMGNCIAGPGYVHYAQTGRSVLAALRLPNGRLLANVEIMPRGRARGWRVEEMKARFNADPSPELVSRFREWLGSLPRPAPVLVEPSIDRADRPRRRPARRPPLGGPLSEAALSALAAAEPSLALLARLFDAASVARLQAGGDAGRRLDDGGLGRRLDDGGLGRRLGDGGLGRRLDDGGLGRRLGDGGLGRRLGDGGLLDGAVARWLADGGSLAELWAASSTRPLSAAIDALDPSLRSAWHHLELLTLDEPLSGSLLSLARRPAIADARAAERSAAHIRWSICHLAQADDPALASAVRRTADRHALDGLLRAVEDAAVHTVDVDHVRVPRSWLGRGGWPALWHESAKRTTVATPSPK
jgi:hypothetical protein